MCMINHRSMIPHKRAYLVSKNYLYVFRQDPMTTLRKEETNIIQIVLY